MAKLVTKYYKVEDDPKTYISPVLDYCIPSGKRLEELQPSEVDSSVLYHMSEERQNILSWFPFSSNSSVLELGAGSGIITRMLAKKTFQVDAFDLSIKMCKLNAQRNQDMDNITIVAGNVFAIQWDRQFDYIVVTDDFINAGRYALGDNAYDIYLRKLKEMLKEDGHLLLAAGNRLGLQYLAGAPDMCSGAFFEGINRYPKYRNRREFSRSEILGMIKKTGYQIHRWYYPYPNHIYPNEIFTSDSLNTNGYGKIYNNYQPGRLELFREDLLAKDMLREGSMEAHVNSFLLDLTMQDIEGTEKILYAKINRDRKEEFQIATVIVEKEGEKCVQKRALLSNGVSHLRKMYDYETREQQGKYMCLPGDWMGDGIVYPYIEGDSLDEKIEAWISEGNIEEIEALVRQVIDGMSDETKELDDDIYNNTFVEWFGTEKNLNSLECIKPANIDMILSNIMSRDGQYVTIDNEWIVETWVPKKFIMWRCINELVYVHPGIEDLMTRQEIYDKMNISLDEANLFDKWNHHFVEEYVKANQMYQYCIPQRKVDLENDLEEKVGITSCLYLDYGNGYNEDDKLISYQVLEKTHFQLTYDIPDINKLKRLRWDPLEGSICRVFVDACIGQKRKRILPINAYIHNDTWDEFTNIDPQYEIPIEYVVDGQLTLRGNIEYLSHKDIQYEYLIPDNIVEKIGNRIHKRNRTKSR